MTAHNQFSSFEHYLITIGMRSVEYSTYSDSQLFENIEYFKDCYDNHLSPYKSLEYLYYYLQEKSK